MEGVESKIEANCSGPVLNVTVHHVTSELSNESALTKILPNWDNQQRFVAFVDFSPL